MSATRFKRLYRLNKLHKIVVALMSAHAIDCLAEQTPDPQVAETVEVVDTAVAESALEAREQAAGIAALAQPAEAGAAPMLPVAPTVGAAVNDGGPIFDPQDSAVAVAVADGVTTGLAVSAGAIETNPLVVTSPVGLLALTGLKIGMVKYADTLPQEEKRTVIKTTSAVWGGAAVNNLLVLMAAPPPFPIAAGLIMGVATWKHMEGQYRKEDEMIAAREAGKLATAAPSVSEVPRVAETSGY